MGVVKRAMILVPSVQSINFLSKEGSSFDRFENLEVDLDFQGPMFHHHVLDLPHLVTVTTRMT